MQLIIVTGLSGSGKTIAIRELEDCGVYCIDNLPASFLTPVVHHFIEQNTKILAVAIDARSSSAFEKLAQEIQSLSPLGVRVSSIFLTASDVELIKRFSETRRRHPLSNKVKCQGEVTLQEAVTLERALLEPMLEQSLVLDTTGLLPQQLRQYIRQLIGLNASPLTLTFESFAFKHGIPAVSDLVFDVRCLLNPYYDPTLRPLTGLDQAVCDFLSNQPLVGQMLQDIEQFIERWLPAYQAQNRQYLTISIGCTGGQHRSVYIAQTLGLLFAQKNQTTIIRHRALKDVTPQILQKAS